MTTKRFKSVCTETGREFGESTLGYNGVELDKWGYAVGQTWSIEFEDENDDPRETDVSKVELCQSTGLHDANRQEVFEGDVIKWDGLNYCCEWDFESAAFVFNVIQNQPGIEMCNLSIDADQVNGSTVIGNRWMPHAELQARAEAVSDRY